MVQLTYSQVFLDHLFFSFSFSFSFSVAYRIAGRRNH
jgi:hypothetical protein